MDNYHSFMEGCVISLLSPDRVRAARKQLNFGPEIVSVEGELQRLYRPTEDAVNLESLFHTHLGHFFKPVGFYHRAGEIVVLKEYESTLHSLVDEGRVVTNYTLCPLSLKANAVVGAFSVEAMMYALMDKDVSFEANGMKFDIFINTDGDPQVWADDGYGFNDAIAIYKLGVGTVDEIVATMAFEEECKDMMSQSLLSAFKHV